MSAKEATEKPAVDYTKQDLVLTRVFNAPRELVFKLWTDPKHLAKWWGPRGFTNPRCEVDVRPGGAIRIDMRAPNGVVYPMGGVFQEIAEPERLVFTSIALDKDGNAMFENLNTVTFVEQNGKTTQTIKVRVLKTTAQAAPHLAGMEEGWSLSLDRLDDLVGSLSGNRTPNIATANVPAHKSGDREIVSTRIFDAPRGLVWNAWTDPKQVTQWWGPNGFTTTIHEMNVRPGGVWRLTMRGPDGADYKNKIVFGEVSKPERLVYRHTPEHDSEPVNCETTVTFAERNGKTELTMRMVFPSAATLDHVVEKYGAVEGLDQTLGCLAEYLAKLSS